jgi:hypothetical protein
MYDLFHGLEINRITKNNQLEIAIMKKKQKLSVVATGEISPTTDCPKCREWAVYRGGELLGYVDADTKKYAMELADDRFKYV